MAANDGGDQDSATPASAEAPFSTAVGAPVRDFLGLVATGDRYRWLLPVTEGITGGRGALYGGCGLAAVIEAAEGAVERPTAWATVQFVAGAGIGEELKLAVEHVAAGRRMSQVRVTASDRSGAIVLAALVALGRRESAGHEVWERMPKVPPPEDCPPRKLVNEARRGGLRTRIDERTATTGDDGFLVAHNGRSALWVTMPGGIPACASALALVADDVSAGTAAAMGDDLRARQHRQHDPYRCAPPPPTGSWPMWPCTPCPMASATAP